MNINTPCLETGGIRQGFLPIFGATGIRAIRLHDLRYTFGAMLIAGVAPLNYMKEQTGRTCFQVTDHTCG